MTNYLNKNIFDVDESCIISSPTGTGKSTALISHIESIKEPCIIVSPLNELAMQLQEKNTNIVAINSDTSHNILADIMSTIMNKHSIIISLKTFSENHELFLNIPVYIDECHKLIEYNELCKTEKLISDIRNKKFRKIIGMTATPLGLDILLDLKIIETNLIPEYNRTIYLDTIASYELENILGCVMNLYREHGKLVVMYNNKRECMRLSEELKLHGLKVLNYNSEVKEVKIINERFSEDFDILFCTSSLTTGVSIRDEYHGVCILRFFDTINAIPQFFARNRNNNSTGTIIRSWYAKDIDGYKFEFKINEYAGRTVANNSLTDIIKNILMGIKSNISKSFLQLWLKNEGNYNFVYGKIHSDKINLRVNSKFMHNVNDQRDYFINNITPKFDKGNYIFLDLMYKLYNYAESNMCEDEILKGYLEGYTHFKYSDDDILIREKFYDHFYDKVRRYYYDKAKNIAENVSTESMDVSDFEKMFLNKKYVKKELKKYCVEKYSIKNEVFKNINTINIFLKQIGFEVYHKYDGDYIVKIEQS